MITLQDMTRIFIIHITNHSLIGNDVLLSCTNVSLVKDMTNDLALDSLCSRLLLRLTCLLSSFIGGTIHI